MIDRVKMGLKEGKLKVSDSLLLFLLAFISAIVFISVVTKEETSDPGPPPSEPKTMQFVVDGFCEATITHEDQTLNIRVDGHLSGEVALPASIDAPDCTVKRKEE